MTQSNLSDYETDGVSARDQPNDKRDDPDGYKDEQTLRNMYWDEGMSTEDIADHFDKGSTTICSHMDKNGVERRSVSEAKYVEHERKRDHPKLTEELLRELYVGKRLSPRAIANEVGGCSEQKVKSRLDEHEFERRSMSEASRIRHAREPVGFSVTNHGYEIWQTQCFGEEYAVPVHRLAAVAWFGWDAVIENVVHHKNGHRRDNREGNLDPSMTNTEHSKMHEARGDIGFTRAGNQHAPPPDRE